jgi:hypothetical protein
MQTTLVTALEGRHTAANFEFCTSEPSAEPSRQQILHNLGIGHARVCQGLVVAMMRKRKLVVIKPQLMKNRGMQIGYADTFLDCSIANLIRGTVGLAGFKTAAGKNQAECISVMVSTGTVLGNRQPTELA